MGKKKYKYSFIEGDTSKIIEETAKQLNLPKHEVATIVNFQFNTAREMMEEFKYAAVTLPFMGT